MAFRKLQFKNVQGSRSGQTIQLGELAVDETTNQLFIGDGSTAGGTELKARPTLSTGSDLDGGAIDPTSDVFFISAGQSYTLADGEVTGHRLTLVFTSDTGTTASVVVASVKYLASGNLTTTTNYTWELNTGGGSDQDSAIRDLIWDGTHWVLHHL